MLDLDMYSKADMSWRPPLVVHRVTEKRFQTQVFLFALYLCLLPLSYLYCNTEQISFIWCHVDHERIGSSRSVLACVASPFAFWLHV